MPRPLALCVDSTIERAVERSAWVWAVVRMKERVEQPVPPKVVRADVLPMTTLRPIPSPRPKQVISLEDWDKKALLSDEQQRSVLVLQKACEDKSLPIKVCFYYVVKLLPPSPFILQVNNDEPISRPSSPAQRGRFTSAISPSDNSRPGTPTLGQSSQNQHRLLPKSLIQTPQQFFDWFATIERQATHSKEAHFRAHIADVTQHIETCDHLSKSTNDVQRDVDDMLGKWKLVEANGKSLKESSEMLLGERVSRFSVKAKSLLIF